MMMKFLQHYGDAIYLGFALSVFADVHFYNWRFYAIVVPTIILIVWSQKGD